MTVHARRLARQCRERLVALQAVPVVKQQPTQQRATTAEKSRGSTTGPLRRPATGGAVS